MLTHTVRRPGHTTACVKSFASWKRIDAARFPVIPELIERASRQMIDALAKGGGTE